MDKKHIVILTGAGISAESGLKTFRDHDGLWMGYRIEDVATPEAFSKNPQLVLDFYNQRRRDVAAANPNAAHAGLVALEQYFRVTIITQNVDDLHERAGSTNVLHLHGEIFKMRSIADEQTYYPCIADIQIGDMAPDGYQLRPHIVWFGEAVPLLEQAAAFVHGCDALVVIGTSLQVYPAASLVHYAPADIPLYVVDKKIPSMSKESNMHTIALPATEGVGQLETLLLEKFKNN